MIARAVLVRATDDVLDKLDMVDAAMSDPGVHLILQLDERLLRVHRRTESGWDLDCDTLETWSAE